MLRRTLTLAGGGFVVALALAAAGSGHQSAAVLRPGETLTIIAAPGNLAEYGEGAAAIAAKQGLFQYAGSYGWGAAANYAKSGLVDLGV